MFPYHTAESSIFSPGFSPRKDTLATTCLAFRLYNVFRLVDEFSKQMDRLSIANKYREKSDESMKAAFACLEQEHLRGTFNRSWYAAMQIVTAAAYQLLSDEPRKGRPNWKHDNVPFLFESLVKKTKTYEKNRHLIVAIDLLRQQRNNADYAAPDENQMTKDQATVAVQIASKVRAAVDSMLDSAK